MCNCLCCLRRALGSCTGFASGSAFLADVGSGLIFSLLAECFFTASSYLMCAHCGMQVLDDSTDVATATIVDRRVAHWKAQGFNIARLRRTNRRGFKAGALKEGMQHLKDCEFVAIFDADFKPDADFLVCLGA